MGPESLECERLALVKEFNPSYRYHNRDLLQIIRFPYYGNSNYSPVPQQEPRKAKTSDSGSLVSKWEEYP